MYRRFLLLAASLLPLTSFAQTTATFVPLSSVWKYLDDGSNQGTAWRAPAFDDSTWAQGPAELGYGDQDEATVVGYGPNANSRYITTYFRKSFVVTGAASFTAANLRVRRDDGVVIYLNGTEVFRNTMPSGNITYTTLASAAVTDEVSLFSGAVSPALLVEGTNILAVEIHQASAASTDISFDMDFTGTIPTNVPAATPQAVSATEDTAKPVTLTGTDPNGDPLTYAIATQPAHGTLTGSVPNIIYTPALNFNGTDTFTFTVSDGTNTSSPATVTITVAAVNDVPVANASTQTVPEEGTVTFDISGSDVESPYGMLSHYTQQAYINDLTGIADGCSGATWNTDTGTLFFIRNVSTGGGHSYEYTAEGVLLRTITQTGFVDTEAIAWMHGNTYAIAEENNNQRISICTIIPGATTLERTAAGNVTWTTPVGNLQNFGIECMCYDPGRNVLYYTAEKPSGGVWPIWSMNPQTGVSTQLCDLNASLFTSNVASDLSDMAFDRATDTLLLLSHESNRIIRINRAGLVQDYRGFATPFTQAEALALTPDRQRLFVAGEPKQFARYALPVNNLTYSVVSQPAHGTLSGLPPHLTYTPAPNYSGPDSFTFIVNDGALNSPPATITLNVTASNDAPSGGGASCSTTAGDAVNIPLPVTDPDGDALTIQTSAPAHGTVTIDGTTVTYTANASYAGLDSFTYTVSDGLLSAGPYTVSVTVLPNDPPVAADQSLLLDEDTPAAVSLTAIDAENHPLTWATVTPPAHGALSGTAPDLIYTPSTDYHGADSFTFRSWDGHAWSNIATVAFTIVPVNDPPVAHAETGTVPAGHSLFLALAGSDPDGDIPFFALVDPPFHGTLTGTPPNVTYTAAVGYEGPDSFTFTTSDGTLTSSPATVTLSVTWYNFPPLADNGSAATAEDTATAILLTATDPEAASLSYTITTPPAHGTVTGTAPALTYTPESNYHGTDSFAWTAGDGEQVSAPAVFNITVSPVNDPPVANAQSLAAEEDAPLAIALVAPDPDGDALTFEITQFPAHGTVSGVAPDLIYTPDPDWNGSDEFLYTVTDGAASSAPAAIAITVVPVNDLPVTLPQSVTTPEDTPYAVTLTGADADGDTLTWTLTLLPAHGTLAGTAPNLTYIPETNWNGIETFAFIASDGQSVSAPAVISITVEPMNDAPAAVAGTASTTEDIPIPVNLTGSDPDDDTTTFVIVSLPSHGTLSGTVPNLIYTPHADWNGTDEFLYCVTDGTAASEPVAVTITIAAVNDRPVVVPQSVTIAEDTPISITLTGSDPDADALTWTITLPPAHGTLSGTAPHLTYTPAPGWNGLDSFSFAAGDGSLMSTPTAVTIDVLPENDAPSAPAQFLATGEDTPLAVTLAGSDDDGDTLAFSIVAPPAHGTLSGSAPALTYTPAADWNGTDTFSFIVTDGFAVSVPAVISLAVSPVNDAPLANNITASTAVAVPVDLTLSGSDVDGDPLTWNIVTPPARGLLSGTGANRTYTPNPAWSGTDQFTFTVSDGTLTSSLATAVITVAPGGPWQIIARTGHTAPGTGGASFSALQPDFVSDAAGRASFRATAGAVTGIWTEGPDGLEAVVTQGAAAPGVAGAVFDAITSAPWAAGDGELLVYGKLLAGPGGVTTSSDFGYWLRNGGAPALIAREGGAVPGMDAAVRFTTLSAVATLQAGGNYAYAGTLKTNSALGITSANDTGIWGTFGAPPRLLVREGNAAPGSTEGGLFDTLTTVALTANGQGQFGFTGAMKIAGGITAANCYGLWLRDAAQFGLVARGGQAAPGTPAGAVFNQPLQPSLGGSLAFRSTLAATGGGVTTASDTGIWTLDNGVVSLLAREGSQAPGIAAGGLFTSLTESAATNSTGELAFRASLVTSSVVKSTNNAGVWVRSRYTSNTLALVAREGFTAPGAGTGTFAAFDYPYVSHDGRECFTAGLTVNAASGVTASNDRGLWVRTYGNLSLAFREGSPFTLAPGDIRTVANITLPAAPSSGRMPLSEEGRLLVMLSFTDGSSALYHYRLPMNAPPVASAQTVDTTEDTPAAITLSGTDSDGDALSYVVTFPPAHGTLTGTAPNLIYTPAPNWSGADTFTFVVNDSKAAPVAADIRITVASVNDAPVATPLALTTTEDAPVAATLAGSDIEGSALGYTIVEPPAHGILAGIAPALTYIPAPDYCGQDSFTWFVNDGTAASPLSTATVTVTPVNDAPLAHAQTASGTEDTAVPVPLSGFDPDGDVLTFALTVLPAHGTLSGTAPHLTYTPDQDWHGPDSLSFTVSDGSAISSPAVVTLQILPVNDTPVAGGFNVRTERGEAPAALQLVASDVDGDALSFFIITPPSHGSLSGTAPFLTYTPEPEWEGSDLIVFIAGDGAATSTPAVISIAVRPSNANPVAVSQAPTTPEDTSLPVLLTASDADSQSLAFAIISPPAHGTLAGSPPAVTYIPGSNWSGTDEFIFVATDGEETSQPAAVSVTVTPVNDAPVADPVNVSTEVGMPRTIALTGTDMENSPLSWRILTPPAHGSLSGSGAALTYTPVLAWSGADQFTFEAFDGDTPSASATATISVASNGSWQLVARTGVTAPGAGGASFSAIAADYVSDASGRASFRGTAGSVTAIWTEGVAGLEPVILQGAAVPGASGAVFDAVTSSPWAAGDGEVLVYGKLLAGTGGVTTANDLGYWLRSPSATTMIVREGDPVPGLVAAARFNTLTAVATLEAGGNYAYAAAIKTNSSLGISSANDTGIWGTFGAPQRLLVRENTPAPGSTDGGVFDNLSTTSLTSNGSGQFGFSAAMKIAGSVTAANCYGLWLWDPAQFGLIARGAMAAPGAPAGTVFNQPLQPALGGSLAFRATLAITSGGVTTASDTGLWSLDTGAVTLLAREGSLAPGVATGGLFNNISEGPSLNDAGELAFRASLVSGSGVTSANNSGVWVRSRYTGAAPTLVARKGTFAPGAATATFSSFDYPFVADDGRELFTASLTVNSASGVTAANDRGLWARTAAGTLSLILREGTPFTLAPGDTRTVSAITLPSTKASGRTPLSENGGLLVLLTFTDSSSALYHSRLP